MWPNLVAKLGSRTCLSTVDLTRMATAENHDPSYFNILLQEPLKSKFNRVLPYFQVTSYGPNVDVDICAPRDVEAADLDGGLGLVGESLVALKVGLKASLTMHCR